jgi:preprotein translocase subunit SecY
MSLLERNKIIYAFRLLVVIAILFIGYMFVIGLSSEKSVQILINPCYTEYTTYCCALFLGAYVNVKRLMKLGSL